MILRAYEPHDGPALLALFRDTIRRINSRDYNPEQIQAWSSDEIDGEAWCRRFVNHYVLVAEIEHALAGFCDMEPDGHIVRFFVSADHQGLGVGRRLLTALHEEAIRRELPRVYAEVSITAKPFFEKLGYTVESPQIVLCRGVEFVNYRMEHRL